MSKTDWKTKSKENAVDKKRLNKKIKELTKSRNDWKLKSMRHKARADKLASDLKKLMTRLRELVVIQ
jgi:hypothetical protein